MYHEPENTPIVVPEQSEDGLIVHLSTHEGTGSIVADASGRGNHCSLLEGYDF